MKIFRFDEATGRKITQHGSDFAITKILQAESIGPLYVNCMHIPAGGVVGYHQATVNQLFLVVQGMGFVRGEEEEQTVIQAGEAAFWTAGEFHESGSETGMTALVFESNGLEDCGQWVSKDRSELEK